MNTKSISFMLGVNVSYILHGLNLIIVELVQVDVDESDMGLPCE